MAGPGTELSRLLARFGVHAVAGCRCQDYARRMNRLGPSWCEHHVDRIVGWMRRSAQRRRLPFSRIVARQLVRTAIHRSRAMDLSKYFERAYCVNLARRPDRWQAFQDRFPSDWPFREVQRVNAVDGRTCKPPGWWSQGGGAWGCYRTHLRLIEQCLNDKIESVLLLEDDALFMEGFASRVREFLAHVPEDWGMLYLGGQHLYVDQSPPARINDWVYQPYNINRTHAFALRGETMREVYRHLCTTDWQRGHHIDHHLGRFHMRRTHKVYCPREWLVGQAEGQSNISGRRPPDRFWAPAERLATLDSAPFVAIIGLHSSGSSCVAGVLYHLGVHLGNHLGGYYGNDPNGACGFEAVGLAQLCEAAIPFPTTEYKLSRSEIWKRLTTLDP